MLRWADLAEWRGPTVNHGGAMTQQRGMVVHIAQGGYEGTIGWQKNPTANVSSHFVVAGPGDVVDGKIAQVVDLDVSAWTQVDGNGRWVSVENSGFAPHALTAAQLEANARLYARGMHVFGWPAKLATSPADTGLAYHGLACAGPGGDPRAPWSVQNTTGQDWGHCDCPGVGVIAQLPAILARAIEINGGDDVSQDDVIVGTSVLWDKAANRIDSTGRNFANDVYAVISSAVADEFAAVNATLAEIKAALAAGGTGTLAAHVHEVNTVTGPVITGGVSAGS